MPNLIHTVYTDGGCIQNPGGPGAAAAVILDPVDGDPVTLTEGYNCTTNNRMELMAVIIALEYIKSGSVILYSDSQYVLNCMSGAYAKKKNLDLWKRLDEASRNISIDLHWVQGHSGDQYNELCDKLCRETMYDCMNLKEDTGYAEDCRKRREFKMDPHKPEAMGMEIQLPDQYQMERIHMMDAQTYADLYHTNISCAESILQFRLNGLNSFKAYIGIKAGGQDYWSRKKEDALKEGLEFPDEVDSIIHKYIDEEKDRITCLRWYRRGLPLHDSIRKVLVDNEVKRNCFHRNTR